MGKSAWRAFGSGAIASGLLWLGAGGIAWINGGDIIVERVADAMYVGSPFIVLLATSVLAALCGGVGAVTGYAGRAAVADGRES